MNEQYNEKISSNADNQQPVFEEKSLLDAEKYKQMAIDELQKIQDYVQKGALTQDQGQNLMNYVTQKAFEKYTLSQQQPKQEEAQEKIKNAIDKLPEFFNRDGRIDVFDYLKNSNTDFDEDEISKISNLVEKIENSAVERYLRKKEHEMTLNNENESAKQRLRANAQNNVSDGVKNLVYTREQIGKMSGAEFAKHEHAIMDQLKKGLIR